MRRFVRQAAPPFWWERFERWLTLATRERRPPLHDWQHENKTLAQWFHETVRAEADDRTCAYCDQHLAVSSTDTIDHFVPVHACPGLGLAWDNLYPTCSFCNSTLKGPRWSWHLVRPDLDPVEEWLEIDWETGMLRPSPTLVAHPGIRRRVRRTIAMLGLNAGGRPKQRRDIRTALARMAPMDDAAWAGWRSVLPPFVVDALRRALER